MHTHAESAPPVSERTYAEKITAKNDRNSAGEKAEILISATEAIIVAKLI